MIFEDYTYVRPNLSEVKEQFEAALEKFYEAGSALEQSQTMNEINRISNNLGTMFNLCSIRHSIDTEDEFYKEEQDYMDELGPEIEDLTTKYYQALVSSKFRKEL